ncbi:MAG TPA: alkaline phosphatase, partial [Polyangiales bacterium]
MHRLLRLSLVLPLGLLACCADAHRLRVAGSAADAGRDALRDAGERERCRPRPVRPLTRLARNVIVFMGDGMGPVQLSTARYAKDGPLRIDELLGPALADTDSLTTLEASDPELSPTDSAAAASVIATGTRVHNYALSVTADGDALETVLELCKRAGKATGLVTTSYFFDASPAAFASHQASRDWYDLIAHQMLTETQPDVIMGSGSQLFDDARLGLPAVAAAAGYEVLRGVPALMAWDPAREPRVLGLFETDFQPQVLADEHFTMTPALERRADSPDPTLATMVGRALDHLARDQDGFFLFAEDEILDQMGHRGPAEVDWSNRAYPAQAAALDDAIGVALDWVDGHSSFSETLIVVLADHETGGYRYDPALGPGSGHFGAVGQGSLALAGNHTRTPTAVYALGPGSEALEHVRAHADTHALLVGELGVACDEHHCDAD